MDHGNTAETPAVPNALNFCERHQAYTAKDWFYPGCHYEEQGHVHGEKIYPPKEEVIEKLAAQVHEQWCGWAVHMLNNFSPENLARWHRQRQTPYDQLPESEKDSDRKLAAKILYILEDM